jgi:hypothetical protein
MGEYLVKLLSTETVSLDIGCVDTAPLQFAAVDANDYIDRVDTKKALIYDYR